MSDRDEPPVGGAPQPESGGPQRRRDLVGSAERGEQALADAVAHIARPAWQRVTDGESSLTVAVVITVVVSVMLALPTRLLNGPRFLLPALAVVLLVVILVLSPRRLGAAEHGLRRLTLALIAVLSMANIVSGARLVVDLVRSEGIHEPATLLLAGGGIWALNVAIFGLWYWQLDGGGPTARAQARRRHPAFLFPQMTEPELSPHDWEPTLADYVYTSFTNATAFSPTDVMPMAVWAKMMMMLQSAVSLATVALVVARAVNILR